MVIITTIIITIIDLFKVDQLIEYNICVYVKKNNIKRMLIKVKCQKAKRKYIKTITSDNG